MSPLRVFSFCFVYARLKPNVRISCGRLVFFLAIILLYRVVFPQRHICNTSGIILLFFIKIVQFSIRTINNVYFLFLLAFSSRIFTPAVSALVGHSCTQFRHRIHSVLFGFLDGSTHMSQTSLHFPQETHLEGSHFS